MDQLEKQLEELKKSHQKVIEQRNAELEAIKELRVSQDLASAAPKANKALKLSYQPPSEAAEVLPSKAQLANSSTQIDIQQPIQVAPEIVVQAPAPKVSVVIDDGSTFSFDSAIPQEEVVEQSNAQASDFSVIWSNPAGKNPFCTDCSWCQHGFIISYASSLNNSGHGSISYFDAHSPAHVSEFSCPCQPSSCRFVPYSSDQFVVGGSTGLIFLYDKRESSEFVAQSQRWNSCHTAPVIGQAFLSSKRLVSVAADGSIYQWDIEKLEKSISHHHLSKYKFQGTRPTAMALNDIGNLIIGLEDGSVVEKCLKEDKVEEQLYKFNGPISNIDFRSASHGYRTAVAISSLDGTVAVYSDKQNVRTFQNITESYVNCGWRPGHPSSIFTCGSDGVISIEQVEGDGHISANLPVMANCCKFNADGSTLCVGCIDGTVHLISCPNDRKAM